MFENKTEAQARKEILAMVAEYADRFHNQKKEFKEGDRIPYASRVYDKNEMVNLVDSSLEFWLTSGRYTEEFEKKLGDKGFFRSQKSYLVNLNKVKELFLWKNNSFAIKMAGYDKEILPVGREKIKVLRQLLGG